MTLWKINDYKSLIVIFASKIIYQLFFNLRWLMTCCGKCVNLLTRIIKQTGIKLSYSKWHFLSFCIHPHLSFKFVSLLLSAFHCFQNHLSNFSIFFLCLWLLELWALQTFCKVRRVFPVASCIIIRLSGNGFSKLLNLPRSCNKISECTAKKTHPPFRFTCKCSVFLIAISSYDRRCISCSVIVVRKYIMLGLC